MTQSEDGDHRGVGHERAESRDLVKPLKLSAPGRGEDLRVRVSAPDTGNELPIIVFSHGSGSSLEGYGPLADFWAAHGFVVIQPTHLDSRTVGLPHDDPRTQRIWRFRVEDMKCILDQLDLLEDAVPGLRRAPGPTAASPPSGTPSAPDGGQSCWACGSSIRRPRSKRTCPTGGSKRAC